MKRIALLFALASLPAAALAQGTVPGAAGSTWSQIPGVIHNNNLPIGSKQRLVTVDPSGTRGDFRKVSDAVTWVGTQTRDAAHTWLVTVLPGTYEEPAFTVPAFVTVQGSSPDSAPILQNTTKTTGTFITLAGRLARVAVRLGAQTLTGTLVAIEATGSGSGLTEVAAQATVNTGTQSLNLLQVDSGATTWLVNSHLNCSATTQTNTALVEVLGTGILLARDTLFNSGDNACAKAVWFHGTGASRIFHSAFSSSVVGAPGFTVDVTNDSSGTVSMYDSSYVTISGSGAIAPDRGLHLTNGTSNPSSCSVGETFFNKTTPAVCLCLTANTWKCATLS